MDTPSLRNRLTGPALAVAATLFYHGLLTLGHAPLTVAVLFPFVVAAAYTSGLRAGLVAAFWVSGYSAWLLWAADPLRVLVIGGSLIMTNVMVGILKRRSQIAEETRRKAAALDALNGNVEKLHEARVASDSLLDNWGRVDDEARRSEVRFIRHRIAEVLTVAEGWRELYREKQEVIAAHEKGRQPRV